jgi:hypothetical protein
MMALPNDPAILLSVVNTLLRNRYADLDVLCDTEDISRRSLERCLASIGYIYIPRLNQFR